MRDFAGDRKGDNKSAAIDEEGDGDGGASVVRSTPAKISYFEASNSSAILAWLGCSRGLTIS